MNSVRALRPAPPQTAGCGGASEPPVAVAAPSLCNGFFSATGKCIASLPLKNHDLRKP
jgi:CO/xanthine dehydrogenase Mo-binding subunit